jgi:hypothetical protein
VADVFWHRRSCSLNHPRPSYKTGASLSSIHHPQEALIYFSLVLRSQLHEVTFVDSACRLHFLATESIEFSCLWPWQRPMRPLYED